MDMEKRLDNALKSIRKITNFEPKVAIVCGTGLGNLADKIKVELSISYNDIEGMPISTVQGHKGRFVFGYIKDIPVVMMQGRIHLYEGYKPDEVVIPIRIMGLMGAKILILTNAAGGISFINPGDIMLIRDQICMVPSSLIGKNLDSLGVRFPDMSNLYDKDLRNIVKEAAIKLNIPLNEGVYIQMQGPAFETPAEVKMAKILGADAVGMSTAIEALAAHHMGMKVIGISTIANPASGIVDNMVIRHEDVLIAADKVEKNLLLLGEEVFAHIKEVYKW